MACSRHAQFTLTFDYGDRLAAIGPLAFEIEPHSYDLCARHAERLNVPEGWTVLRPTPLGFD
ncbi:hypothetical protein GCM10011490_14800 [Pseudoclavibacter endophyticus]|nr:hypothetical protein GCM10011490_14800 [Pseudoclavibacter endophyticus]